jgi:hypothetical protein
LSRSNPWGFFAASVGRVVVPMAYLQAEARMSEGRAVFYVSGFLGAAGAALVLYALVHDVLGIPRHSIFVDALASAAALSLACVVGRRKRI